MLKTILIVSTIIVAIIIGFVVISGGSGIIIGSQHVKVDVIHNGKPLQVPVINGSSMHTERTDGILYITPNAKPTLLDFLNLWDSDELKDGEIKALLNDQEINFSHILTDGEHITIIANDYEM